MKRYEVKIKYNKKENPSTHCGKSTIMDDRIGSVRGSGERSCK